MKILIVSTLLICSVISAPVKADNPNCKIVHWNEQLAIDIPNQDARKEIVTQTVKLLNRFPPYIVTMGEMVANYQIKITEVPESSRPAVLNYVGTAYPNFHSSCYH